MPRVPGGALRWLAAAVAVTGFAIAVAPRSQAVKGHGGPEMPVWGDAFKNVTEGYKEADVKAKIDALVDHL